MKKFLLLMFICLNVFATVDSFFISQITTDDVISHRYWSDTMTWNRSANDSLFIFTDDTGPFEILNWDYMGFHGIYGCDSTVWYYQTANTEEDFDSMATWDSLGEVGAGTGPDIQENLTSLTPSKLIRFMAIANGSMNALMKTEILAIEDYR